MVNMPLKSKEKNNMENNYKKELVFVSHLLLKLIYDEEINFNERQSLENIIADLDFHDLKEDEFRY